MVVKLIFGPPGTGKTTKLLSILEKELETYSIENIAYVSFTREGVYQGKSRAKEKLDVPYNQMIYFRTLHSIAFKEIGMKRVDVIDKKMYKIFSDKMGMNFTGYYTEEFRHNDDRYLFFSILHRNNPKVAINYMYDMDETTLRFVQVNYKRFKQAYKIFDYTDMIELFIEKNKHLPVKVAIIDEAQDLTSLQWNMIWVAFRKADKIYIAGDDDQAIYEWSGADVEYFLKIKGDMEILNKSYRLPNRILNFSKSISSLITHRVNKHYEGLEKEGKIYFIENLEELNLEDGKTWMFLSRNRCFLNPIETFIREKGLVYKKNDELSIKQEDVKAINLYTKVSKTMIMNDIENITLKKYLKENIDLRKPWYESFKWDADKIMYYRDIIGKKTNIKECRIRIETIHSVKGDEADNVVVTTDVTKQVYYNLTFNGDSEHRVFYVACTRTKENLYILLGQNHYQYNCFL